MKSPTSTSSPNDWNSQLLTKSGASAVTRWPAATGALGGPDDEGGFWDGGWRRFGKRKNIWEGDELCRRKIGTESDLERSLILGIRILGVGEYLGAEEDLGQKNMWGGKIRSAEEYFGRKNI